MENNKGDDIEEKEKDENSQEEEDDDQEEFMKNVLAVSDEEDKDEDEEGNKVQKPESSNVDGEEVKEKTSTEKDSPSKNKPSLDTILGEGYHDDESDIEDEDNDLVPAPVKIPEAKIPEKNEEQSSSEESDSDSDEKETPEEVAQEQINKNDSMSEEDSGLKNTRQAEEEKETKEEEISGNPLKRLFHHLDKEILVTKEKSTQFLTTDVELKVDRVDQQLYEKVNIIMASGENEKMCGPATCFASFGTNIAIGNSVGVIRIINLEESSKECKVIFPKEVMGKKVTCIDINDEATHLVAGYENGTLMIWDLMKHSLFKTVTAVHTSEVINAKFLRTSKLSIISSEISGDISTVEFPKAVFGTKATNKTFLKNRCAFALAPFQSPLPHSTKEVKEGIFAFADTKGAIVGLSEPDTKILFDFKIKNPSTITTLDWGMGGLPGNSENENVVLAVAAGHWLQLVEVRNFMVKEEYVRDGYYYSDSEIIGVWWIAVGVLLIMTDNHKLIFLSSSMLQSGEFKVNETEKKEDKGAWLEEKEFSLPEKILFKNIQDKKLYNQTAIRDENKLLCLVPLGVHETVLYEWNKYLQKKAQKEQWEDALRVAIQLFEGNLKGFAGLSESPEIKEALLKASLKQFLGEFLEKNKISDKKHLVGIVIEFCIRVQAQDYLFMNAFNDFKDKQLESIFFNTLESYILQGSFSDANIPPDVLNEFVEYYINSKIKSPETLQKLLLKLTGKVVSQIKLQTPQQQPLLLEITGESTFSYSNLMGQDLTYLEEICISKNLYWALIYILTIDDDVTKYLKPIKVFFAEMNNRRKNENGIDTDENKLDKNNSRYMIWMILWYIKKCFTGEKFPERIEEEYKTINKSIWPELIYRILDWLMEDVQEEIKKGDDIEETKKEDRADEEMTKDCKKESNMKVLIQQEFQCFVDVFALLFEQKETRDFLLKPDEENKLRVPSLSGIISKLSEIREDEKVKEKNTDIYFYKFVAKIAAQQDISLPQELCYETATKLGNASFGSEQKMNHEEIQDLILKMLMTCKLSSEQLKKLTIIFSQKSYKEVLIFLREKNGEFMKCFEMYLAEKNPDEKQKLFKWLAKLHSELKEGSKDFNTLKEAILDKLEILLKIKMDYTKNVVKEWFSNEYERIVDKLETVPKLQLEFLQSILQDKEKDIETAMKDESVSQSNSDNYKRYYGLLSRHIELLCQHDPKNVVPEIKKKYYPTEMCLEICKKNKNIAAVAYLLKRTGDFSQSLNVYLEVMKKISEDFFDDRKRDSLKDNLKEYEQYFYDAKKVCKKNAKVAGSEEAEQDLWFVLLEHLYNISLKFNSLDNIPEEGTSKRIIFENVCMNITGVVNKCIKELLTDMMKYISFTTILTRVTDIHGELELKNFKNMFTKKIVIELNMCVEIKRQIVSFCVPKFRVKE